MFPHRGTGERSCVSQPPRLLSQGSKGMFLQQLLCKATAFLGAPGASFSSGGVRMHIISSCCDPSQSAEQMYLSSLAHLPGAP